MNKVLKVIIKYSTGRNVAVFGALYCFSIIIMIVFFKPGLMRYTSMPIMDLTINYGSEYVYDLLMLMGPEGRSLYIIAEYLDYLFVVIYSIFFTLLVAYVFKKAGLEGKSIFLCALFVPIVGLFDAFENVCFLYLLFNFPVRHDAVVQLANLFTLSKWVTFGCVWFMLLAGITTLLFKRFGIGKLKKST